MFIKIVMALILVFLGIKILKFLAGIAAAWFDVREWERRTTTKFPSELREAFMMECSGDMAKTDPYARDLDKRIRMIDKDNKAMKENKKKIEERWSKWSLPSRE